MGVCFRSVRNSCGFVDGLKSQGFRAAGLSACGFSVLIVVLPNSLVGDELVGLVEESFQG